MEISKIVLQDGFFVQNKTFPKLVEFDMVRWVERRGNGSEQLPKTIIKFESSPPPKFHTLSTKDSEFSNLGLLLSLEKK